MSNNIVIDCSFAISCVLPDEKQDLLDISNCSVYVPSIFHIECINALNIAVKRKRIELPSVEECINIINSIRVNVDNFCTQAEAMNILHTLINKYGLTAYDASYLELAIRLNAAIVTQDKALVAACAANRVLVLA